MQSSCCGEVREAPFRAGTVAKTVFLKKVGKIAIGRISNVLPQKQFRCLLFIAVIRSLLAAVVAEIWIGVVFGVERDAFKKRYSVNNQERNWLQLYKTY